MPSGVPCWPRSLCSLNTFKDSHWTSLAVRTAGSRCEPKCRYSAGRAFSAARGVHRVGVLLEAGAAAGGKVE
jgi:hypothetical protein